MVFPYCVALWHNISRIQHIDKMFEIAQCGYQEFVYYYITLDSSALCSHANYFHRCIITIIPWETSWQGSIFFPTSTCSESYPTKMCLLSSAFISANCCLHRQPAMTFYGFKTCLYNDWVNFNQIP